MIKNQLIGFSLAVALLIALCFFSIKPLFFAGFFPIHDDAQVARVFEMGKSLSDGMFPVRWVSDLGYGYGYPVFNFYAPLAYYFGGMLTMIGLDALIATKIMIGIGMIVAGITMYLFAKQIWGGLGGFLASILYVYAPYHAVQLYVRGAVAELWAYAFIPLVFYGVLMTVRSNKWRYLFIGSFAYAGVILSHNLTAFMVTPFLILFALVLILTSKQRKKREGILSLAFLFLVGLLLAGFYWLPAILESKYTNVFSQIGGGADYHDHFVCLPQIWDSPWGFGGSARGCLDGLSFRLGKLHIVVALIVPILILLNRKQRNQFWPIVLFFLLGLFLSIFMMTDMSVRMWNILAQLSFIQFPWRFLSIASFFSSVLGGGIVLGVVPFFPKRDKKNYFPIVLIVIVVALTYFLNLKLFVAQKTLPKNSSDYTNLKEIRFYATKLSDEYLPKGIQKPKSEDKTISSRFISLNGEKITNIRKKTQEIQATVVAKKDEQYSIPLAYFPAWHAWINGSPVSILENKSGILLPLKAGNNEIELQFEQTLVEKIGNMFSLFGVFILIAGIIMGKRRGNL